MVGLWKSLYGCAMGHSSQDCVVIGQSSPVRERGPHGFGSGYTLRPRCDWVHLWIREPHGFGSGWHTLFPV